MKRLFLIIPFLLFALVQICFATGQSYKVGIVGGAQGLAPATVTGYFLTKATVYTPTSDLAFEVQVDQDTKMYLGDDTTNYLVIPSGLPATYVVNASKYTFKITSTAATSAFNLRIGHHPSK